MDPIFRYGLCKYQRLPPVSALAIVIVAAIGFSQERWLSFSKNKMPSSATVVTCGEIRVQNRGAVTSCVLPLTIPGARVDYPDDFGLLAGNYAALSVSSDDCKISVLNYNGSLQPEKLGLPDLPLIRLQVRIPYNAQSICIMAANTDFQPVEGEYTVAPVQQRLPESFVYGVDHDWRTFKKDAGVYGKNASFTHPVTFESMICHGIRFIEITYCPLHYNPVTKTILGTDKVDIVVEYNPGATSPEDNKPNIFRAAVNSFTFNGTGLPDRTGAAPRGGTFIVISKSSLFNTATYQDFISYRKEKGFTLADSITADNMSATSITSKVKSLYSSLKMDYVIVLGDETIVPIPTDGSSYHYKNWSRLEGTDNIEDVGLGIFLCDNEARFKNILQHQKWHEAGGAWSRTQLSTAGSEIKSGKWDRFSTGHHATVHLDNPNGGLGYTVRRVYQVSSIPTKYGGSYAGLPTVEFEPWTLTPTPFFTNKTAATDSIVKYWNAGVVNISHRDHGFNDGPSSPPIKYAIFSSGKITSTCSPFFTSLNCLSGNFKGKHTGNFAYLSQVSQYGTCATIAAPVETMSGDNDKLHEAMYAAMYPKTATATPVTNIGQIWLAAHLKGESHARTYFHIFGDPMTNCAMGEGGIPFIFMASPNGDDYFEHGATYPITWSDNISGTVKIELLKGGSVVKILSASSPSNGLVEWTVGPDLVPGADYKMKVTSLDSAALFDQSDADFSIMPEYIITKLPYSESFDTLDSGSTTLPFKWDQSGDDDIDWWVWKEKTPSKLKENSASTGPDGDHTSGDGVFIYVEATDNNPTKKAEYLTPKIHLKNHLDPKLSFWYHMFSNYQGKDLMGHLYLDICVDGVWKNEVFHVTKNQGDVWKQATVDLNPYKGARTVFRFRGITGSGFASDVCLDDFTITSSGTQADDANLAVAPARFELLVRGSKLTYRVPATGGTPARAAIMLFDLKGKLVSTLYSGTARPGTYSIPVDKTNRKLARGMYQCRMQAGRFSKTVPIFIK